LSKTFAANRTVSSTMSREFPDQPIVGVGVIVFRGDEVLLVRRGKPPRVGEWSIPGGAQELGETVAEAAVREIREETGLEIDIRGLVDVIDLIRPSDDPERPGVRHHYTLIDLVATWVSGDPVAGDDVTDARWMPVSRVDGLGLWTETVRVIEMARTMLATQD
jgi:ADP-ribose pyrophosphatase YjhB (NUDIX family)